MHLVAGGACDQISGMAALDATGVRWPVQMTSQTDAVRLCRRELGRVTNIRGGRRFRVLSARPVTRFTGLFDPVVRILLESLPNIFVARLACLPARVARLLSPRARCKRQDAERGQYRSLPNTARVLCQR